MTEDEFRAAVDTTQLREPARLAAWRVLVHGWSAVRAAEQAGRTKQWALQAAARVRRAHRERIGCPRGWAVLTVRLPPEDALDVLDLERRRLEALQVAQE